MAMPRTLEVISDNFKIVRPALGLSQPRTRRGQGTMRPERETEYTPPSNAEVMNAQSYNFVPPHV